MFGPGATPAIQDHVLKMMLAAPETTAAQAMSSMFVASNWTEETMPFPLLGIYADKSGSNDLCVHEEDFPQRLHYGSEGHRPLRDVEKPGRV